MSTICDFPNPKSVIQRSPPSGVFGSSKYVGDKEGFVTTVIAKWYINPGNTIPVESTRHLDAAESLYDFYLKYREVSEKQSLNLGSVLHTLYVTGSIKDAEKELAATLIQAKEAS